MRKILCCRSSCSESTSSSSTENTSQPTSPCQPFPEVGEDPYSYWVGSPNILTSPESAALFYRSTVEPGQMVYATPSHCCCESHHCSSSSSLNMFHTYQEVYEKLCRQQPGQLEEKPAKKRTRKEKKTEIEEKKEENKKEEEKD